jgi:hypothetical protein
LRSFIDVGVYKAVIVVSEPLNFHLCTQKLVVSMAQTIPESTAEERVSLIESNGEATNGEAGDVSGKLQMLNGAFKTLRENTARNFKNAKPLSEVFDMSMVSKPANTNEVLSRVKNNVSYFKTNYSMLAVGTTALVMLMNPWSLMVLAFLALGWFYVYVLKTSSTLVIGGREFSDRESFWLMSGASLFVIFFLTSVGATIFYALGLSMIMVGAHASLRIPDDTTLFEDEVPQDGQGSLSGILSMFRQKTNLTDLTNNV